ncbi:MAG: LysR family transcriptional regulator, partial [Butyricicoccaceae bacterium]
MYNPQLETFIIVADAGSFNKAAAELFISPPAVIKQINLLEAQLDLTLFVRTHRGLKLTEAGKSLYRDAKYIIGYCRESVDRAKAAMQNEENVIRIGTSPMTPAQSMAELWSKIQEHCPDIKFQVIPFENTPE